MTQTRAGTSPITLEKALALFVDSLSGKNRSKATIRAYQTDLSQFITFLHDTNILMASPQDVQKVDVLELDFGHSPRGQIAGKWQQDRGFMAGAWDAA